ncbi:hypothetical protein VSH64_48360 [Amycolatopsis rhabdoformis]|uniref:Uncharacterized protein n=1 Tax=Amycolatopsis rhabdoformis TaxID=1448059 RepID=A0ABZ1I9W3_9PSEU|nr:hypothetical protein [Amycolatopsis rhabdoformis]WSE30521.1 hypothetical protein VSH64_48360 [Amycolatopsis rhabdoformis]
MSDDDERSHNQINVILPVEPPELTPAAARALLAILIELSDKKMTQVAKLQGNGEKELIT